MGGLPALLAMVLAGLLGIGIAVAAMLRGWQGWLELKRIEIAGRASNRGSPASPSTRFDMLDLKERVRRLEAIATGIDP